MILLRYIRFTIDFDIIYKIKLNVNKNSNNNENLKFKAISDFDYVVDKLNKKSIFEYVYIFVEKSIA